MGASLKHGWQKTFHVGGGMETGGGRARPMDHISRVSLGARVLREAGPPRTCML